MATDVISGTGFDTLIIELVKYGIFGVLFGLLIIAYREKLKDEKALWAARIEDNKTLLSTTNATNRTYEELARSMQSRSSSLDQMGEAARSSAQALDKQADILEMLRRIAEQNGAEMKRLGEQYESYARENAKLNAKLDELIARMGESLRKGTR